MDGVFNVIGGSVTINENLSLSAGTLDPTATNYTIGVRRKWINNGGAFTARGSTYKLNTIR